MKHRKAHTIFPVVYLMKDSPDILIISRLWNKADSPPKAVSERMRAVFIFVEISMLDFVKKQQKYMMIICRRLFMMVLHMEYIRL